MFKRIALPLAAMLAVSLGGASAASAQEVPDPPSYWCQYGDDGSHVFCVVEGDRGILAAGCYNEAYEPGGYTHASRGCWVERWSSGSGANAGCHLDDFDAGDYQSSYQLCAAHLYRRGREAGGACLVSAQGDSGEGYSAIAPVCSVAMYAPPAGWASVSLGCGGVLYQGQPFGYCAGAGNSHGIWFACAAYLSSEPNCHTNAPQRAPVVVRAAALRAEAELERRLGTEIGVMRPLLSSLGEIYRSL